LSKLYDQLKNAAFARKQALDPKKPKRGAARAKAAEPEPAKLVDQKVIDDESGRWRDEIAGKLHEVDEQLEHVAPVTGPAPLSTITIPEFDSAAEIREREATMAKLADAARKRVDAEAAALDRAREREKAERALHAQSEALLEADIAAAKAAREREAAEQAALQKAVEREAHENAREAAARLRADAEEKALADAKVREQA
jgi:hypothetical protein